MSETAASRGSSAVAERVEATLVAAGLSWDDLRESVASWERDALVLHGSLVLPFPVETDDFDLLLITEDADTTAWGPRRDTERLSEQVDNGFAIVWHEVRGVGIDVEVWPRRRVDLAVSALPRGVADVQSVKGDFTRLGGLERKVGLDLFHALLLGSTDPIGSEVVRELTDGIDTNAFFAWNRDYHLVQVQDGIKGVTRSMRETQTAEAYLKMCWAADNVVDALLFHHGYSIARWKWRLRYLHLLDPSIAGWYRAVRFGATPTQGELADWLELLSDVVPRYLGKDSDSAGPRRGNG